MTKLSAVGVLPLFAALPLMLGGCAPSGFPAFDRTQSPDDRLPREIVETIEMGDFDLSTARAAGEYHGVEFYVLQPREGTGPCIAIADGVYSSISCGAGGRVEVGTHSGVDVRLAPAYAPVPDGWVSVGDNVVVRD